MSDEPVFDSPYDEMNTNQILASMKELILIMYNNLDIELKTDLSEEQIQAIIQIEYDNKFIKEKWGIDLGLDIFTKDVKRHYVSVNRKGRGEFVEAIKSIFDRFLKRRGTGDRLMGSVGE